MLTNQVLQRALFRGGATVNMGSLQTQLHSMDGKLDSYFGNKHVI